MKKQPNSTGSLSACYHFDTPSFMLYLRITRLSDFSSSDGFKPFSTNANNYP